MIKRFYAIGLALAITGLALSLPAQAVGAFQTEFTQEISLIDCTVTDTEDGSGSATDTRCDDAILPTVTPLETTNRRPVIHGTFAASEADGLRVFVNGTWYQLDVDAELTTDGNNWRLDLSGGKALALGAHEVIVEVLTSDGLLIRDNTSGELVIMEAIDPEEPEPGLPSRPGSGLAILAPQSGELRVAIWMLWVLLAMIVTAVSLLVVAHRHRRGRKNDILE